MHDLFPSYDWTLHLLTDQIITGGGITTGGFVQNLVKSQNIVCHWKLITTPKMGVNLKSRSVSESQDIDLSDGDLDFLS